MFGAAIDSVGMVGLLTFADPSEIRRTEFPPLAANAEEFRARARPQPSRATPAGSTTLGIELLALFLIKRRSDKVGCLAAVEVELEFETP
jgi:hypothetical protein